MQFILKKIGLNSSNSIVIGSGILQALGIRKSHDIDLVVDYYTFNRLKKSGKFKLTYNHRETLSDNLFEIGTYWDVLGKPYNLEDFINDSIVIGGIKYITLDFLYQAKKSWLKQENVRQKRHR